ncbi:hypothetical protein W97_07725 [Coniosporium apollinis CBS 100218]|uniref:NAD(P)-binding protein n=1 Tax=Coniosporium apollinis (strain CBS 100218) TaxID=1168221 RepID=R7Z384_CONA1|nr:uncharacterized protein W97_07725 [Coniosporium apollinis CBS 100218]EON68401.1 hypothetical protein W97_07725 [Coniosporium apollinis CBS 100218]
MSDLLDGKVVLVTGGASGLGKAIVIACLGAKATVVISDINEKSLEECEKELGNVESPDKLSKVVTDVSNEDSAAKAIQHAIDKFSRLDVLINCAGIMDAFDPVDGLDLQLWNRVIAVNLTGPVLMSKYAVKHFLGREKPSGAIMNIGSIAALRGALAAGAAYTASKHGLVGITRNTAAAYAKQGIRCNIVLPGTMETNIAHSMPACPNESLVKVTQSMLAVHPNFVQVDHVAKTVVHLASDSAEAINGAIITADGGFTAF